MISLQNESSCLEKVMGPIPQRLLGKADYIKIYLIGWAKIKSLQNRSDISIRTECMNIMAIAHPSASSNNTLQSTYLLV